MSQLILLGSCLPNATLINLPWYISKAGRYGEEAGYENASQ